LFTLGAVNVPSGAQAAHSGRRIKGRIPPRAGLSTLTSVFMWLRFLNQRDAPIPDVEGSLRKRSRFEPGVDFVQIAVPSLDQPTSMFMSAIKRSRPASEFSALSPSSRATRLSSASQKTT
jgi:hypothetical protein